LEESIIQDIEDLNIDLEENIKNNSELWIDKYTSHKYFDLLTDESINRKVLTWIKSWDAILFPD